MWEEFTILNPIIYFVIEIRATSKWQKISSVPKGNLEYFNFAKL
jgi:hypothetical protein